MTLPKLFQAKANKNQEENPWIGLVFLVRIRTSQWVTAIPGIKKSPLAGFACSTALSLAWKAPHSSGPGNDSTDSDFHKANVQKNGRPQKHRLRLKLLPFARTEDVIASLSEAIQRRRAVAAPLDRHVALRAPRDDDSAEMQTAVGSRPALKRLPAQYGDQVVDADRRNLEQP
jgi:hypothetical protein